MKWNCTVQLWFNVEKQAKFKNMEMCAAEE